MSNNLRQNELLRLIGQGFPFEISVKTKRKKPGILGYFQKRIEVSETRKFLIKEPTLHTLDKIALEALKIDEESLLDSSNISANIKNRRYFKTMAKIVAITVAKDEKEEKELEELFFKALRPRDLKAIIDIADLASNMPDFTSSILTVTALKKERIESQELPDSEPHTDIEE